MKTIKQVEITTEFLDGFMPDYETLEEGKIYISEQYCCAIHRCLCGCGEKTVMPIHKEYGWILTKHKDGKISFTPSVGNFNFECKSHYIITNNKANFV